MATEYVIHKTFDPSAFKVDYRKELNAEQFAVVEQGEGPCLVLAGAGSGKTRTIVYRVAYLLEQGVDPSQILLVTFTNKAAKEMMVRIESLLGQYPKGIWGGTFHSVANRLLRKYGTAIGFNPNFTILDQDDSRDLISACVKSLHIDTKKIRFPSNGVIQGLISLCSNTGMEMTDVVEMSKPEFVRVQVDLEKVFRLYRERKERNNAMDFDDLLVQLRRLLRDHPQIKEKLAGQFKYVLVDEYQDTNHLQDDIVRQLSSFHNNLLVVGDDAQSIYSFRGADITNILDFPKRYPNAKTFKLETNYRSTQAVLDVANEIIKHNPDQFQKSLKHVREGSIRPIIVPAATDDQEAEFIAQRGEQSWTRT
jgi:DNA helicase-2/ATP-dependent DNA helicase PcrA